MLQDVTALIRILLSCKGMDKGMMLHKKSSGRFLKQQNMVPSKKIKCLHCNVSYRSEFCIQLHRHIHQENSSNALKEFQCYLCKKPFIKFTRYKWHLFYHKRSSSVRFSALASGKDDSKFRLIYYGFITYL